MEVKHCVACGMANEGYRSRCQCGFSLTPSRDDVVRELRRQSDRHKMGMLGGLALVALGAGLTAATFIARERVPGTPAYLWYGAIGAGLMWFLRAFSNWRDVKADERDWLDGPGDQ